MSHCPSRIRPLRRHTQDQVAHEPMAAAKHPTGRVDVFYTPLDALSQYRDGELHHARFCRHCHALVLFSADALAQAGVS